MVYAGFWRRFAAYLVDTAILLPFAQFANRFTYASKEGFLAGQAVGFVIGM